MPRWLSRTLVGTIIIVVLVIGLMRITAVERTRLTGPERVIRDGLAPLQSGFTSLARGTRGLAGYLAQVDQLLTQNEELRQQISDLAWKNNQLLENEQEVIRLRSMLDFKQANTQYDLLGARVIARGPSNWYSTLVLDCGLSDGVARNMVVITPEGLVGRIMAVSQYTTEVLLITDSEGPVGSVVLVQENRVPGVVEGVGDGSGTLVMKHIAYDAPVQEGQSIVTSGLGDIFPKGIRIGQIQKVDREAEPSGLQKYAIIRPEVDFDRLEEVFIILKDRSSDTY
ncbi:MAG: rod shape-determining protein MreC [Syntrophomonadaceae bacterium]|nr:rod shape-determining protein MreC [Syntrophomonadaceae bacterium]